jgi:hypothetical protein
MNSRGDEALGHVFRLSPHQGSAQRARMEEAGRCRTGQLLDADQRCSWFCFLAPPQERPGAPLHFVMSAL